MRTKVRLKLQLYMQISCLELEGNPLKHTPPSEILSMGDPYNISELTEWIEEAEEQILLYVNYSINQHKIKRQVIFSNDTDSFVLVLRFIPIS